MGTGLYVGKNKTQGIKKGYLFPGNTILGAVFYCLMDIFVRIIIQGQYLYKTCVVYPEPMGCQLDADFTKYALSHIKNRYFHGCICPLFKKNGRAVL